MSEKDRMPEEAEREALLEGLADKARALESEFEQADYEDAHLFAQNMASLHELDIETARRNRARVQRRIELKTREDEDY